MAIRQRHLRLTAVPGCGDTDLDDSTSGRQVEKSQTTGLPKRTEQGSGGHVGRRSRVGYRAAETARGWEGRVCAQGFTQFENMENFPTLEQQINAFSNTFPFVI